MRIAAPITLFLALAVTAGSGAVRAQPTPDRAASQACVQPINEVAGLERIPVHILNAISLVESGRSEVRGGTRRAWPWTVYALGKGRYLNSKRAAIAEVRRLRLRRVTNVDVGYMQVNLFYHADAFTGLEEAFDLLTNVSYTAAFLKELWSTEGAWARAVAKYHSSTRAKGKPYWQRVRSTWHAERRRIWNERREARIQANLARRAARQRARVVWMCLPRFDGDPVFCNLLNGHDGNTDSGVYEIELDDFARSEQCYLHNTAIVTTTLYDTHGSAVEITDFAPRFKQLERVYRPTMAVRLIKPVIGNPRIRVRLRPVAECGTRTPETIQGSNHIRYIMPSVTLRPTTDTPVSFVQDEVPFVVDKPFTLILGPDETLNRAIVLKHPALLGLRALLDRP